MSEQQMASIAAQVRRARKAAGHTVKGLAEVAGVADGTITRIETGQKVRPGNLRAVLDALGIQPTAVTSGPTPDNIQLAMDLVKKWLMAMDEGERDHAVQELTRWIVITNG
jgi:transcriptional regulator with XRE-family HTH domain